MIEIINIIFDTIIHIASAIFGDTMAFTLGNFISVNVIGIIAIFLNFVL